MFVARNTKTFKAYKVPELKISKYDDILESRQCFELGLTIKDWSRDKGLRDMHKKIPTFGESEHYHEYLESLKQEKPEEVITMTST